MSCEIVGQTGAEHDSYNLGAKYNMIFFRDTHDAHVKCLVFSFSMIQSCTLPDKYSQNRESYTRRVMVRIKCLKLYISKDEDYPKNSSLKRKYFFHSEIEFKKMKFLDREIIFYQMYVNYNKKSLGIEFNLVQIF